MKVRAKAKQTRQLTTVKVCSECIGDEYLKKLANRFGHKDVCSYCNCRNTSVAVSDLAVHIDRFFKNYFARIENEKDFPKRDFTGNGLSNVKDIIRKNAKVNRKIAEDIQNLLMYTPYNVAGEYLGKSNPYGKSAYYGKKRMDSHWDALWSGLKKTITKENRVFNSNAKRIINSIFGDILRPKRHKSPNMSAIIEIGPNTKIEHLFRAREFQNRETLHTALGHPDRELGPPPSLNASAGRMNSHGISVFYGATSSEVAIAEIRPVVDSTVIVARFNIIRKLRLLDVTRLQSIFSLRSMFRPSQKRIIERIEFFSSLCKRVSAPVMPKDQATDYLVTQAISDYLSDLDGLSAIDGIIYRSAQAGGDNATNVVLFHKASRVKLRRPPTMTKIDENFEYLPDADSEFLYHVYEDFSRRHGNKAKDRGTTNGDKHYDRDEREFSLRLRASSISVHHVKRVCVRTRRGTVKRTRMKRK